MWDTLVHNAYWLVYAGTILEGETALLLGSLAASQGAVQLVWVIIAAFAGATTGDQISYQVFRRFGPGIVERSETLKRRSQKARRLLKDHPVKFIILSRFFWGLRSACMLALAASDVPSRVFVPANLVRLRAVGRYHRFARLRVLRLGRRGHQHHGHGVGTCACHHWRNCAVRRCRGAGRYAALKFWRSRETP